MHDPFCVDICECCSVIVFFLSICCPRKSLMSLTLSFATHTVKSAGESHSKEAPISLVAKSPVDSTKSTEVKDPPRFVCAQ